MVLQAPERTESLSLRLSVGEKERLQRLAVVRDVRVGQLVRQLVNRQLAELDAETRGDGGDGGDGREELPVQTTETEGPHDGRAA